MLKKLNDIIIDHFQGEQHNFLSFNDVERDIHVYTNNSNLYSISSGGLTHHVLKVKKCVHFFVKHRP